MYRATRAQPAGDGPSPSASDPSETASAARLLPLSSIQANIRAGGFPEAETNGVLYLKVPAKTKGPAVRTRISQTELLGMVSRMLPDAPAAKKN